MLLEQKLHARYAEKREFKEWFKLNQEDIDGFERTAHELNEGMGGKSRRAMRGLPGRPTIGNLILTRLLVLGQTEDYLSRATGIPKQNLSPILRGERPLRVQHMLLIEAALCLTLDYNGCTWPEKEG